MRPVKAQNLNANRLTTALNKIEVYLRQLMFIGLMLSATSCQLTNSGTKAVDGIGELTSCQNNKTLWLENFSTFHHHHAVMSQCMDALAFEVQKELEIKRGGDSLLSAEESKHTTYSKACIAEVKKITDDNQVKNIADDDRSRKTITELFLQLQNKCLGKQNFPEQEKLIRWLIDNKKVLPQEEWRIGRFIYPLLPQPNRGAIAFDRILPAKGSANYDEEFEFYSLCRRTADASFEQYLRIHNFSKAYEDEGCTDPTKNWDRNIPNPVNAWVCDAACRYSGSPCHRCSIDGAKDTAMTCATEVGSKHALSRWCDNTLGQDCELSCEKTTQDDIVVGRRLVGDKWIEESDLIESGGQTCLASTSGSTSGFSATVSGKLDLWFGADLDTPFGGVESGATMSTVKGQKFDIKGEITASFNICSNGFYPWMQRQDGVKEADHNSYYTCTANLNRMMMTSDTFSTGVEISAKTKSPVIKITAGGKTVIEEQARSFENQAIVWMSQPIPASGATPNVLRATCQVMVEHWKNHSLQYWLQNEGKDAYLLARKVGGVEQGFCTEHSDCKSTLYNGTSTGRGKIYRCLKPEDSNIGRCVLRSTGRWLGSGDNSRWCGERCETGIELLGGLGGAGQPACDQAGEFTCQKTTVPYRGWHWVWQDPKELTESVYQCVPKKKPEKFGDRMTCRRQPGINGD